MTTIEIISLFIFITNIVNYNQSMLQNSKEIILLYCIIIMGNVCYLLLFSLQIY